MNLARPLAATKTNQPPSINAVNNTRVEHMIGYLVKKNKMLCLCNAEQMPGEFFSTFLRALYAEWSCLRPQCWFFAFAPTP